MNTNKIATKSKALFFTSGPSIDASYGPWDSIEQYEDFLHNDLGLESPYEYTKIGINDPETDSFAEYIYENDEWKVYGDLSSITSRLEYLESKASAEIAGSISGSVSLSKTKFYAGYNVEVVATGSIKLPSTVTTDHILDISISGNGKTQTGSAGQTSISLNGGPVSNTTTFNLTAHIGAPYTKTVTASATITKYCPIYIGIVNSDVDTAEKAISAIKKDANLYSPNNPETNIKNITNKSFTYESNQRLAFICGQSNIKIHEVGSQLPDGYIVDGQTTTINGMTAYVYVTNTQQAGTRALAFNG